MGRAEIALFVIPEEESRRKVSFSKGFWGRLSYVVDGT
jgi:hypothetical protein